MLPTSSCGPRLSARAIGHTGFTGTSLWLDPDRDLYVVCLTNRVHAGGDADGDGIRALRVAVHDAVAGDWNLGALLRRRTEDAPAGAGQRRIGR